MLNGTLNLNKETNQMMRDSEQIQKYLNKNKNPRR